MVKLTSSLPVALVNIVGWLEGLANAVTTKWPKRTIAKCANLIKIIQKID